MTFYTYLWLRRDGTPYYAGKGKGNRAITSDGHKVRCPKDIDRIILQEYSTEDEAFAAEISLISFYGRKDNGTGCLRNLTDGGEGTSGRKLSAAAKNKIGRALRKCWSTPEGRKRQMLGIEKNHNNPETSAKRSLANVFRTGPNKGRSFSQSWINNMRAAQQARRAREVRS